MNSLFVITIVLAIASCSTATYNVESFPGKHTSVPAYHNGAVVPPPTAAAPPTYIHDVRFNPLKYNYASPGPVPVYTTPADYVLAAPPAPRYVPASAFVAAPAAPLQAMYLSPEVLAHLQTRQFIGRHFVHAYHH